MDLKEVAKIINEKSTSYDIGELQNIRKRAKNLLKRSSRKIFSQGTVFKEWGWHSGGRRELQFNIGIEGEFLRYGVAFSLKRSRSLLSTEILIPKIELFNEYLIEHCEKFSDLRMWHYENDCRSKDYMPSLIPPERVKEGVFIFIGKKSHINNINYNTILETFDRLLPLYLFTESTNDNILNKNSISEFRFISGCKEKLSSTSGSSDRKELNILLKHNDYQSSLYNKLSSIYGKDNVGTEIYTNGLRIDLVVKHEGDYWFYEIKTAPTARGCIRQALGQILEYSYWPNNQRATKLIIAGSAVANDEEKKYIYYLSNEFDLPLEYQTIV